MISEWQFSPINLDARASAVEAATKRFFEAERKLRAAQEAAADPVTLVAFATNERDNAALALAIAVGGGQ